ncbi:MAG: ABC transporter ATP-binding protein [Desulfosarcina sp.]|nr:ABC transporter ATP-binding protein [Desulfobacterales bacterium]
MRIEKGETLAVIGKNGSGKSTLLRIIAGIYPATRGHVQLNGRLAAVLELGTALHPELPGIDNIVIYGALLGLSRKEIKQRMDAIVAFSGLGNFIDMPMKHYSSGMQMRLALSVALHTEPDIMAVDEGLATGDEEFRVQVKQRIRQYCEAGGTLILVTHFAEDALFYCARGLLLEQGCLTMDGEIRSVLRAYGALPTVSMEENKKHGGRKMILGNKNHIL